jgi:hypothetical protein
MKSKSRKRGRFLARRPDGNLYWYDTSSHIEIELAEGEVINPIDPAHVELQFVAELDELMGVGAAAGAAELRRQRFVQRLREQEQRLTAAVSFNSWRRRWLRKYLVHAMSRHLDADVKATNRATSCLETVSLVLPSRVVNEEIGDWCERIDSLSAEGRAWKIYATLVAALFWTFTNTVGYFVKAIGKRQAS